MKHISIYILALLFSGFVYGADPQTNSPPAEKTFGITLAPPKVAPAKKLPPSQPLSPSLKKTEIVPQKNYDAIADPFSRGLVRAPRYSANINAKVSEIYRPDDFRALDDYKYYKIAGLSLTQNKPESIYLEIQDEMNADSFHAFYIPLKTFNNKNLAKQFAKDFSYRQLDNISNFLILRSLRKGNSHIHVVEIGPFIDSEYALATCQFLKEKSIDFSLACGEVKKRLVSKNELAKKHSVAILSLSQIGVKSFQENSTGFNTTDLVDMSMRVSEGEYLGAQNYRVVRINQSGIYVASPRGDLALIPSQTFPINFSNSLNKSNLPANDQKDLSVLATDEKSNKNEKKEK